MIEDMKSKLMEMAKKKGKKVSGVEGESLKNVLEDLMGQASSAMADKVKGKMQKVSVMSDSKEGLKEGLEKAEDAVEAMPGEAEEGEAEEEESAESMDMEGMDDASKLAHLEQMIKELKAKADSKRMI